MEKSSQIRNNYSYTRGGARGKKRDLPTFELEIISVVFHERWRETRFRFIKKRLWRCPWPEIARRGVKISLTSDRVCWLGDFHFSGKHDPFSSLFPSSFASLLSFFSLLRTIFQISKKTRKKESYSQRSSIIQTGPRLVSKKCRPFSQEERIYIYIYGGINLGYIFRENSGPRVWKEKFVGIDKTRFLSMFTMLANRPITEVLVQYRHSNRTRCMPRVAFVTRPRLSSIAHFSNTISLSLSLSISFQRDTLSTFGYISFCPVQFSRGEIPVNRLIRVRSNGNDRGVGPQRRK